MCFRPSKGDQFRRAAVVSRVSTLHSGAFLCEGRGGFALIDGALDAGTHPPAARCAISNKYGVWKKFVSVDQAKATQALRKIAAEAGLHPQEFALHSLRITGRDSTCCYIDSSNEYTAVLQR